MRIELSQEHVAAVGRRRRIINHYDHGANTFAFEAFDLEQVVKTKFEFTDREGNQTDSIWWDWSEGNLACYPSEIVPQVDFPQYKKWFDAGIDPMRVFLEATKGRGLEVFHNYRVNGSDNDVPGKITTVPMKEAHPEWLIDWNPGGEPIRGIPWNPDANGYWNFAIPEVRAYKLSILRELAENYDFDGISLDFARTPYVLPHGRKWEHNGALTELMRSVRAMLLEVAEKRGRPFLLAARVPENLLGCHFDGMDVETWARERLVDLFVLGVRTVDVDIAAFRRITAGTHIKLYPCHDDYHATDGYKYAPIEVLRGIAANWWQQGADGITVFNFNSVSLETLRSVGLIPGQGRSFEAARADWEGARQALEEIGDPQTLRHKDKVFVVERRAGGHPVNIGYPEQRRVQHWMYFNSNVLAPLPTALAGDGFETLLTVAVGDDVNAEAEHIDELTLRVLLSDPSAEDLPEEARIEAGLIRPAPYPDEEDLRTLPISKGTLEHLEIRLNGALLELPSVEEGWLVYDTAPVLFAVGENLLGLRATEQPAGVGEEISVEKLEVHVKYR